MESYLDEKFNYFIFFLDCSILRFNNSHLLAPLHPPFLQILQLAKLPLFF